MTGVQTCALPIWVGIGAGTRHIFANVVPGFGGDGAWRVTGIRKAATLASTDDALRRLWERCLLLALVGVVIWAMVDKARDVRSAAELSAFRQSLGALRVALVLDRMRASMSGGAASSAVTRNPFLLLQHAPAGYAGNVSLADAEAGAVAPGAWFFDIRCYCVGYRPRDGSYFHAASGSTVMVFPLSTSELLSAREPYRWRGEVVK